jgi:hypothetical protein
MYKLPPLTETLKDQNNGAGHYNINISITYAS